MTDAPQPSPAVVRSALDTLARTIGPIAARVAARAQQERGERAA